MTEFVGTETFIALQKSLLARHAEFACNPVLSNGGRIMNILDPEAYGWENIRAVAEQDRFVGLTMVDRDSTLTRLQGLFGETAEFPYWQVFTGMAHSVVPACTSIVDAASLAEGWRLESHTHPDEATIAAVQALNAAVGVAPAPAYYLRGEALPSALTCLYDHTDRMVACAIGTMRYHPQSKLAGWMFAGSVSVHPDHRRKRLGTYVNAALLRDSHAALGWTTALEQAKADNHGSVGMITNCGLTPMKDTVTVLVNLTGGYITR